MRRTLLLATLLLTATAVASLAPTASANACVSDDPVKDAECEAARAERFATCFVTRFPQGICPVPL